MADDIRFEIVADIKQFKQTMKQASKVVDKFVSNSKRATTRRLKNIRTSESAIRDVRLKNVQRLMNLDAKQTRLRKREAAKRARAEIREEKRIARERERLLKKQAAQRKKIYRGIGRAGKGLGALFGIAGGATVIFKARDVLKFDEALARTSVQAGITTEEQMALRESINMTSVAYGAQRDVILKTVNEIVDKSGDIKLASDNLETIAKIIRGTGAEAEDVGQLFASIRNAFKGSGNDLTNSEVAQFIEILIAQGDQAQITLANLAGEGEKLFGAFKGAGLRSKQDFINFGALIQTAGETGTESEAATAATRFLSELTKKQKQLRKFGVDIFKPGSKGDLRELDKIIKDILEKTGGDVTKLQTIFSERAIKPLQILATEFRTTGGEIKSFTNLINLGSNATDNINRKFDRVSKTASQGFERMNSAFTVLLDDALAPNLDEISNSIIKMTSNPSTMKEMRETFKALAEVLKLAIKIPNFFLTIPKGLAAGIAMPRIREIREKSNLKLSRMRQELERNRLLSIEGRSPEQEGRLGELNFNLQNNIIVDPRGKILGTEAQLEEQKFKRRVAKAKTLTTAKFK